MINCDKSFNEALRITGLLRQEIGDRTGLQPSSISRASTTRHVSCKKLEMLAKAFDMKVSEFIALGES